MYPQPDSIPPDEVRAQLERVLASHRFDAADSLACYLRVVVHETLAGRGQSLEQDSVASQALGPSVSLNSHVEPIVRVQAGRLRRALRRYYETLGAEDPVIIEVPRGSYVPIFRYN
jgi:hypothetical protein